MRPGISAGKKEISPSDYSIKQNALFSPSEDSNKFKLTKNNLSITLIDKSKLDYSQVIDAIQITEKQIQKMLQFAAEREPISRKVIEDQVKAAYEEKQLFSAMIPQLNAQVESVTQRLAAFKKIKQELAATQESNLKQIEQLDLSIKTIEQSIASCDQSKSALMKKMAATVKAIDDKFYKRIRSLLGTTIMVDIITLLLSLIKGNEQIKPQEINDIMKDYQSFIGYLNSYKHDKVNPALEDSIFKNASNIENQLTPQNVDPTKAANKDIFDPLLDLTKNLCKMGASSRDFESMNANITKYREERKQLEGNAIKKKVSSELLTEDVYLEEQLKAYYQLIGQINEYIEKKNQEIKENENILANHSQNYFQDLGKGVTEAEKQMVYKPGV